jgi:hypothetical protein
LIADTSFLDIGTAIFMEKYRDKIPLSKFQCSLASFPVQRMKSLFSRRADLKRRPSATEGAKIHWVIILCEISRVLQNHQRIVNVNETCSSVPQGGLKTKAPISAEKYLILSRMQQKIHFGVMTAITVAAIKLRFSTADADQSNVGE